MVGPLIRYPSNVVDTIDWRLSSRESFKSDQLRLIRIGESRGSWRERNDPENRASSLARLSPRLPQQRERVNEATTTMLTNVEKLTTRSLSNRTSRSPFSHLSKEILAHSAIFLNYVIVSGRAKYQSRNTDMCLLLHKLIIINQQFFRNGGTDDLPWYIVLLQKSSILSPSTFSAFLWRCLAILTSI